MVGRVSAVHPGDPRRDNPYHHDRPRHDEHVAHSVDDGVPPRRIGRWVGAVLGAIAVIWIVAVFVR